MLKTGLLIDKKTRKKKLSELDIMLRIKTAVNVSICPSINNNIPCAISIKKG